MCSWVLYNGRTSWFKHWVGSFPVDSGATPVNLYLASWNLPLMSDCVWCDERILAGFGHWSSHVRKRTTWLKRKKSPRDIWQIILICSYAVATTHPTVKLGILNNLFTDAGGNEVTLVKQLPLVQTLPLVKRWKWNHKPEAVCEMIQKPLWS